MLIALSAIVLVLGVAAPHALAWHQLRQARRSLTAYHPDAARSSLEACERRWPWSASVHLLASQAARQVGDLEAADRELRTAQRITGATPETAFEWALLQAAGGNVREVEEYLQRDINRMPEAASLAWEALVEGYLRVYRTRDAMNCLDVWLKREPDNVRAIELRGRTFVTGKGVVRGAADFRRVLELDPTRINARWRLVECLLNLGAYDEAANHLEFFHREKPDDPEVASRLARCYNVLNRRDEARALLDRMLAVYPDHPACLRTRGQIALTDPADPHAAEAETWARRAAERLPEDYHTQWLYYESLRRQGKDAAARAQLRTAEAVKDRAERFSELSSRGLAEHPLDPALHYEMGVLLIETGHGEVGERWLLSALSLDPDHKPAHAALARYYEKMSKPSLAAEHGKRAQ